MAVLLQKLWMSYEIVTEQLPDPRTKSWPLVAKPHEGLTILAIYALFVLKWGPRWMKNRPPYNLDKLLIIHNIVQVVACSYIFYELLTYGWGWHYKWICEPVDHSDDPVSLNMARSVYHYYLIKYMDLADTVFFVLRKKLNQVSFLHVYHHVNMVMAGWGSVTYLPGGHATFIGLINSFVHVVMYTYYLLTVIDPATKQSAWWKKHLTQLQIVQLTFICIHASATLVVPNCAFPWWTSLVVVPSNFFILCLFLDFYFRTYIKPQKADTEEKKVFSKNSELQESITKVKETVRQRELGSK